MAAPRGSARVCLRPPARRRWAAAEGGGGTRGGRWLRRRSSHGGRQKPSGSSGRRVRRSWAACGGGGATAAWQRGGTARGGASRTPAARQGSASRQGGGMAARRAHRAGGVARPCGPAVAQLVDCGADRAEFVAWRAVAQAADSRAQGGVLRHSDDEEEFAAVDDSWLKATKRGSRTRPLCRPSAAAAGPSPSPPPPLAAPRDDAVRGGAATPPLSLRAPSRACVGKPPRQQRRSDRSSLSRHPTVPLVAAVTHAAWAAAATQHDDGGDGAAADDDDELFVPHPISFSRAPRSGDLRTSRQCLNPLPPHTSRHGRQAVVVSCTTPPPRRRRW